MNVNIKHNSILLVLCLLIIISCEKDDDNNLMLEYGVFVGEYTVTFQFSTSEANSNSGNTELTLNGNRYQVTEHTYITPPYSAGNYDLTLSTITFQDTVIHTEEFDPTLIIYGTYDYTFDGSNLRMSQIDTIYTGEIRKYLYEFEKQD